MMPPSDDTPSRLARRSQRSPRWASRHGPHLRSSFSRRQSQLQSRSSPYADVRPHAAAGDDQRGDAGDAPRTSMPQPCHECAKSGGQQRPTPGPSQAPGHSRDRASSRWFPSWEHPPSNGRSQPRLRDEARETGTPALLPPACRDRPSSVALGAILGANCSTLQAREPLLGR